MEEKGVIAVSGLLGSNRGEGDRGFNIPCSGKEESTLPFLGETSCFPGEGRGHLMIELSADGQGSTLRVSSKIRGKSKYILLLIPLLLSSCLPPYSRRKPTQSLYSVYRAKYPAGSYLLGVGISSLSPGLSLARRRAKEAAFREISEGIKVKVESSITDIFGLGLKPRFEVFSRSTVDMVLEGVRIVEATPLQERGIYLVVAVLLRREAIGRLSQEIKREDLELKGLMRLAQAERDLLKKLQILCRCEEKLLHQMALHLDMEVVAGPLRIEIPSPELTLSEVEGRIERLLNPLRMLKMGGEGTEKDPFKVKVLYGSQPFQGVPLSWKLASEQGRIEGETRTDEEGIGRAVIKGIGPPKQAEARAEIDLKGVIGEDVSSAWGRTLPQGVTFSIQSGLMGAVQSLLQSLSSSGLYGIDIFVDDFTSVDEEIAGDLTLALKDCLARNLLFQLVESLSGYPYILKGKVEDLDSGVRIMASLTRGSKIITTTSVVLEKCQLEDKRLESF